MEAGRARDAQSAMYQKQSYQTGFSALQTSVPSARLDLA
jgi:hypothetical protein